MTRSRALSGGEAGKDPCKTRGALTKLVIQNLEKNQNDKIILDRSVYYACTITHYPKNIGKVKAGQGGGRLKAGRLLHGGRIIGGGSPAGRGAAELDGGGQDQTKRAGRTNCGATIRSTLPPPGWGIPSG